MKPRLSIIIVNWNSGPRLRANVESLRRENDPTGLEVMIVDNASTDGSADMIAGDATACLIRLLSNRGFAAAANTAAREARGNWLLFLNPDIIHTPNNIGRLLAGVTGRTEAVGGCGCLVDTEGRPQRHFQLRQLPSPAWALAELLLPQQVRINGWGLRRHFYAHYPWDRPFRVQQPAAACLLLRTDAFRELGGFDEAFSPAWFEDVDLCRRLRDRRLDLWFVPDARFIHEGGYSASALSPAEFLSIYWGNACRYYTKHHPAFAVLYRRLVPVGLYMRAAVAASADRRQALCEAGRRLMDRIRTTGTDRS
ncbi:MAG TPA: glycosyltransferase family 2 protein [Acidobacteriota bacterium]|nr:glycosyltransferase family 2 protein [Acidobacteriota bacterium]HOS99634.1 glycosyltransferase family 2 protein [Acidobacteriota bacterium]HQF86264.1 glycosyltransferase family 2 protein [Acidobacteriota bacterium]HQG90493.1 glycosyltransferase family 2 protein [Acidobacteriota bacterium]HQK88326.1 glycosyltransferase family 2 protein [Acidobacteriota bacterium]